MPLNPPVPFRNRNHTGWWIFCEVQRWVASGSGAKSQKRFPVWENTRLIRASSREQAYKKALKLANEGMPSETDGGEWQFVGLSSLLPVYEEIGRWCRADLDGSRLNRCSEIEAVDKSQR